MRHKCVCGTGIAHRLAERTFPSFPEAENLGERKNKAMNIIKRTLLICALTIGLSVVAFGQKDDKKPPPKPPPPVIKPGEKPKEEKPKKPTSTVADWKHEETVLG